MRVNRATALATAAAALSGTVAVAFGAGAAGAAPAAAAPAARPVAAAPAGVGYVRLAHLSPDTPPVDVYVTAFSRPSWQLVLRGVGYGQVSPYQRVQPDLYTVAMRLAGAAPNTPAVLSATVRAGTGSAFTVAGLGKHAQLGLKVIPDDLRLPGAGEARLRVIHAAAALGPADVAVDNSAAVIANAPFAAVSGYVNVPAGRHQLKVYSGSGSNPPATLNTSLVANEVYSLIVLDQNGGVVLRSQVDAAAPGRVPVGAVETGAGGAAAAVDGNSSTGLILVIAALALAVLAGLAWPSGRRAIIRPRRARVARHAAGGRAAIEGAAIEGAAIEGAAIEGIGGTNTTGGTMERYTRENPEPGWIADRWWAPTYGPVDNRPAAEELGNVVPITPRLTTPLGVPAGTSADIAAALGSLPAPRRPASATPTTAVASARAAAAASYGARWTPALPYDRGPRDPRRPRRGAGDR
jgi:hypothetical protein